MIIRQSVQTMKSSSMIVGTVLPSLMRAQAEPTTTQHLHTDAVDGSCAGSTSPGTGLHVTSSSPSAHRIARIAPVAVGIVQQDGDDGRHHLAHDVVGVAQLLAVDRAAPGGAAVDQLVAKGVETLEDDAQHRAGVVVGQRRMGSLARRGKACFPVLAAGQTVLVVPVGLEDVAVVEQHADRPGVAAPNQLVEVVVAIQLTQALQELSQQPTLGHAHLAQVVGVGGIEGDPQEDEAAILVIALLRALQPAQGPVDAKSDALGMVLALGALAFLEMGVGHPHGGLLPESVGVRRVWRMIPPLAGAVQSSTASTPTVLLAPTSYPLTST